MKPRSDEDLQFHLDERGIRAEIVQLAGPVRTVEEAAEALGVAPQQVAKTLVFRAEGNPLLVVAMGPERVEPAVIARRLGRPAAEIVLASPDQVLAATGYQVGTVPPVGHNRSLQVLLDSRAMDRSELYAGGGSETALLKIEPDQLLQHSRAELIDIVS